MTWASCWRAIPIFSAGMLASADAEGAPIRSRTPERATSTTRDQLPSANALSAPPTDPLRPMSRLNA